MRETRNVPPCLEIGRRMSAQDRSRNPDQVRYLLPDFLLGVVCREERNHIEARIQFT